MQKQLEHQTEVKTPHDDGIISDGGFVSVGHVNPAQVFDAIPVTPQNPDAPWPLPQGCKAVNPQEAYSDRPQPLGFTTPAFGDPAGPNFPQAFNLSFDRGVLAGRYPNPLCWSGKVDIGNEPDRDCINRINSVGGYAYLDPTDGSGKLDVSMDVKDLDVGAWPMDKIEGGRMRIVSKDFNPWTVEGKQTYQPFMRQTVDGRLRSFGHGVTGSIIQHGVCVCAKVCVCVCAKYLSH
jgi:hypothetical protein